MYDSIWDSPLTEALAEAAGAHSEDAGIIVDLGCGTGLMTGNRKALVVGVDASAGMLNRALRKKRIDRPVQKPIEATGLPSDVADGVLLCNVLHLHPSPRAALREAARLCRPSGIAFTCWPLDGIDLKSVYRADRRLGRPFIAARTAHMLRGLIGIAAAISCTRRNPGTTVEDALFGAAGFDVVQDVVLADCQRVVVLRRQTSSPALLQRSANSLTHPAAGRASESAPSTARTAREGELHGQLRQMLPPNH